MTKVLARERAAAEEARKRQQEANERAAAEQAKSAAAERNAEEVRRKLREKAAEDLGKLKKEQEYK